MTLRDNTGDIMLELYDGMFNGDNAYKGDTVRVEHGWVDTWYRARGQIVLSPTTLGGSGHWQIILNPKLSIPHPSQEWVKLRLKEIEEEEPRYGRDALIK